MKSVSDQYEKTVYWSDEDQSYIGICPELFGGGVHGEDPEMVFRELLAVVDEWVEIYEADGQELPVPKRAVLQAA